MAKFKIGDVVWLKSGSPKMTITFVGNSKNQTYYECNWFDDNTVKRSRFVEATLTDQNSIKVAKPVLVRKR